MIASSSTILAGHTVLIHEPASVLIHSIVVEAGELGACVRLIVCCKEWKWWMENVILKKNETYGWRVVCCPDINRRDCFGLQSKGW